MSVIEKEIERRKAIVESKEAKINELAELKVAEQELELKLEEHKKEVAKLEVEISEIDVEALLAEVEELEAIKKRYAELAQTTEFVQ